MMKLIEGLPAGIVGIRAEGLITRDESDDVMNAIDATAIRAYDMALLLDYRSGYRFDTSIREMRMENWRGLKGRVHRVALMADSGTRELFNEFLRFVDCDGRMFSPDDREEALAYLLEAPFLQKQRD